MTDPLHDPWLDLLAVARARLAARGIKPWVARKGKALKRPKYTLGPPALVQRLVPVGELLVIWPRKPGVFPQRGIHPVSPRLFPDVGFCWMAGQFLDTAAFLTSYGIPPDTTETMPEAVTVDGRSLTRFEFWRLARPVILHPDGRWFALRIDPGGDGGLLESDLAMAHWRSVESSFDDAVAAAFGAV